MAEVNPSKSEDVVMIDGTYGTPRIFNGIYDSTTDITYNVDGLAETVITSMNGVKRVEFTYTYNLDGTVDTLNTKLYALDGTTIQYESIDNYIYVADELVQIKGEEV